MLKNCWLVQLLLSLWKFVSMYKNVCNVCLFKAESLHSITPWLFDWKSTVLVQTGNISPQSTESSETLRVAQVDKCFLWFYCTCFYCKAILYIWFIILLPSVNEISWWEEHNIWVIEHIWFSIPICSVKIHTGLWWSLGFPSEMDIFATLLTFKLSQIQTNYVLWSNMKEFMSTPSLTQAHVFFCFYFPTNHPRHHHRPDHDNAQYQCSPFPPQGLVRYCDGLVHRRLLRLCLLRPHWVCCCQLLHQCTDWARQKEAGQMSPGAPIHACQGQGRRGSAAGDFCFSQSGSIIWSHFISRSTHRACPLLCAYCL